MDYFVHNPNTRATQMATTWPRVELQKLDHEDQRCGAKPNELSYEKQNQICRPDSKLLRTLMAMSFWFLGYLLLLLFYPDESKRFFDQVCTAIDTSILSTIDYTRQAIPSIGCHHEASRFTRRSKTAGSAVAMCLLYGITGIIAIMFLALVTNGAIRAHRYPELYGPRAAFGSNTGQSRVRGLARAVLETLPVYKFGDPEPGKPDPNRDMEAEAGSMGSGNSGDTVERPTPAHVRDNRPTTAIPLQTRPANSGGDETAPAVAETKPRPATASGAEEAQKDKETEGDMKPNEGSGNSDDSEEEEDHLECSICTEDFVIGDDVRILPCNHKFHPACVDTWLVNISGTCPLCRFDLNPSCNQPGDHTSQGSQISVQSQVTEWSAPLDLEFPSLGTAYFNSDRHQHSRNQASVISNNEASGNPNRHSRRASRLIDMHHHQLRNASTIQERIVLLRQMRHRTLRQMEEGGGGASHGVRANRMSLTERLRERFRVRTQTTMEEEGGRPVTATVAGPST